jgi:hypothetical protein
MRISSFFLHSTSDVSALLTSLFVDLVGSLEELRDFNQVVLFLQHQFLNKLHQYLFVVFPINQRDHKSAERSVLSDELFETEL